MLTKKTLLAYILDIDLEVSGLRAKLDDLEAKLEAQPKKESKAKAKKETVEAPKRGRGRPKKSA